jgi:hypothetical protein
VDEVLGSRRWMVSKWVEVQSVQMDGVRVDGAQRPLGQDMSSRMEPCVCMENLLRKQFIYVDFTSIATVSRNHH